MKVKTNSNFIQIGPMLWSVGGGGLLPDSAPHLKLSIFLYSNTAKREEVNEYTLHSLIHIDILIDRFMERQ